MPAADALAVFSAPSQTHAPSMSGHPGNSFGRAVVSGGDAPGACGSASGAAKPRRCRAPAATFGRQPRATSVAGAAFDHVPVAATSALTHPSGKASSFGRSVRACDAATPATCNVASCAEEPSIVRPRHPTACFAKGEARPATSEPSWKARPNAPDLTPSTADALVRPRTAVVLMAPPSGGSSRGAAGASAAPSHPSVGTYDPCLDAVSRRAPAVSHHADYSRTPPGLQHPSWRGTYAPGPPCCTYGLRVPISNNVCLLFVFLQPISMKGYLMLDHHQEDFP